MVVQLIPEAILTFLSITLAAIDGLTLNASVVNGTNKTIVHEMGHYFYLYHTFYDDAFETTCANNTDCANQGDKVCDTEPMLNVDCNTTTNSCNGNQPFALLMQQKITPY
jgi:hypothetical protein